MSETAHITESAMISHHIHFYRCDAENTLTLLLRNLEALPEDDPLRGKIADYRRIRDELQLLNDEVSEMRDGAE